MFTRHVQSACLLLLLLVSFLAGCKPSPSVSSDTPDSPSDQFLGLMNIGKNYLARGDASNAVAIYAKAALLVPNNVDVRLNLANSHLLGGAASEAIREADEALRLEPNSAAAYFVKGSAYLRLENPGEAVKALENSKQIEPGITAVCFQLGLAKMGLKKWEAAIAAFQEGITLEPNRLHSTAHYLLAQSLLRAGRQQEAQQELLQHQAGAEGGSLAAGATPFEKCKHTQARVPFKLEQPEREGIQIKFVDATQSVLGEGARNLSGPVGVIDSNHTGWNSLFVVEQGRGFRLLRNLRGTFQPEGPLYPARFGSNYSKMLVGDLQNDRFEDIVVLGDKGSQLFKFGTNGVAIDVSTPSGLDTLGARDGVLMDLDFTGKLDLIAVTGILHERAHLPSPALPSIANGGEGGRRPGEEAPRSIAPIHVNSLQVRPANGLRVYRQFGSLLFTNITGTSGIPASLLDAEAVVMEDWNRDGNLDVIASRTEKPPLLLEKQRGGRLVPREPASWGAGSLIAAGDFDNDLRPDLVVAREGALQMHWNGGEQKEIARITGCRQIVAFDYDNDGWLDLWAVGEKVRVWRNLGISGFQEQTTQLGLDSFDGGAVSSVHFADFDMDCDSDVVVALAKGGLRYLRNEGGQVNSQVKVRLIGNRSNASGIGCKVEIETGGLRLIRTVHRLPVEVGVGKHQKLDSFLVHWFNWPQGSAGEPFQCKEPLLALELTIQEGSCPYLFAWDGNRFRFVTDILGAAPLGLPIAEGRYISADPEEFVWIGNELAFPPRQGSYQVQITEELREVLYLDEAKLVVVDHEPGTEVHATDKLLPDKPFPPGALLTLHREHPLLKAELGDGQEVTASLRSVDGRRVSPPRLRVPQLRGLAETHTLVLDFGPLDASKPLVMVLNGWLRFGGGMANIAASQDPSLPFPFPVLEAEVTPGVWKAVNVTVGAPAGKTKTILVDLSGKLEASTHRLRLTGAFEIHWDRIALMEKKPDARTTITFVAPSEANLRFRGFSSIQNLPPNWPLTPDYDSVSANSFWTITPGGWCTRYGDVSELIASRDEGLALLNSGDELSLKFAVNSLPLKPAGSVRDFFLYVDGWDKDSDFHVATGTQVEPLPFHGMNDQNYGREKRPEFPSDALHRKYNTRWVEGRVLKQAGRR